MSIYCGNPKRSMSFWRVCHSSLGSIFWSDALLYCVVICGMGHLEGSVLRRPMRCFDDTIDKSFKVCEPKEEFADADVCDMNQPQYAKSFKNAWKRAGFPAPYKRVCRGRYQVLLMRDDDTRLGDAHQIWHIIRWDKDGCSNNGIFESFGLFCEEHRRSKFLSPRKKGY